MIGKVVLQEVAERRCHLAVSIFYEMQSEVRPGADRAK